MSRLIWQPIHAALDARAQAGDQVVWIVAPFAKLLALERLFESMKPCAGLRLVSRWLPGDLVSGVSDLKVFEYLRERGCQLYVNRHIHMKLYVFESNAAVSTSANLTQRGLGYVEQDQANIEIACEVELTAAVATHASIERPVAGLPCPRPQGQATTA